MSNKYVPITKKLFMKHLSGYERHAFITEKDIPKQFKKVVDGVAREHGELFVSSAVVITERLSPLAENAVLSIAKRHGYAVVIKKGYERLRYLYSDGYGHYSSDFYEVLEYSEIHVTALQPTKGDTNEHS